MARNIDALRKEAARLGLKKGAAVEVETRNDKGTERKKGGYQVKRQRGTVIALFEQIFWCDMGRWKESFRYNELIGNENGRKVRIL